MQPRAWILVIVVVSFYMLSCSVNVLESFSDKTTNDAKFYQAKILINEGAWTEAIAIFTALPNSYLSNPTVATWYASAYAGRCGVDVLAMAENLQNIGSARIFQMLMQVATPGATDEVNDCIQAESIISNYLGAASVRTNDQNVFSAFVSLVKIGKILSERADTSVPKDGTPDWASGDACAAGGNISDTLVGEIAVGINNTIASLTASGSSIAADVVTNVNTVCTALNSAPFDPSFNFCSLTDAASITANQSAAVRSLIQEDSAVGIGTCTGDIVACACPP